ncbi:hypothetical protein TNCV_4657262 [Trichonephila clavipes]|nr:hypothetical protein TNCV_4657262 [Trichonephila clavipes]
MREKGGNRLVPGSDYMVDALKLSNQAPRVFGESLQTSVAWRCSDGTQHLFGWPILAVSGQSLASNSSVVDSRYLNLVFSPMEATHNKLFLSSPTKYTVESSWMLVLVWLPFELLHCALTTIVFTQYCCHQLVIPFQQQQVLLDLIPLSRQAALGFIPRDIKQAPPSAGCGRNAVIVNRSGNGVTTGEGILCALVCEKSVGNHGSA